MICMSYKRLIFILLAVIGLLLPTKVLAATEVPECMLESVNPYCNRPQWQDIGMYDILAVSGGSSVAPPTTVRVVNDSPSGATASTQTAQARHYSIMRLATHGYHRTVSGYIYLIRCLRL